MGWPIRGLGIGQAFKRIIGFSLTGLYHEWKWRIEKWHQGKVNAEISWNTTILNCKIDMSLKKKTWSKGNVWLSLSDLKWPYRCPKQPYRRPKQTPRYLKPPPEPLHNFFLHASSFLCLKRRPGKKSYDEINLTSHVSCNILAYLFSILLVLWWIGTYINFSNQRCKPHLSLCNIFEMRAQQRLLSKMQNHNNLWFFMKNLPGGWNSIFPTECLDLYR